MSGNWVHEYFDRKSSEWNIISFLEECDVESFTNKIGYYLTSLESIIDKKDGNRSIRARELHDRYKQVSSRIFLIKTCTVNEELVARLGSPGFLFVQVSRTSYEASVRA